MAIDMVSFPVKHGGSFHSYVNVDHKVLLVLLVNIYPQIHIKLKCVVECWIPKFGFISGGLEKLAPRLTQTSTKQFHFEQPSDVPDHPPSTSQRAWTSPSRSRDAPSSAAWSRTRKPAVMVKIEWTMVGLSRRPETANDKNI